MTWEEAIAEAEDILAMPRTPNKPAWKEAQEEEEKTMQDMDDLWDECIDYMLTLKRIAEGQGDPIQEAMAVLNHHGKLRP